MGKENPQKKENRSSAWGRHKHLFAGPATEAD